MMTNPALAYQKAVNTTIIYATLLFLSVPLIYFSEIRGATEPKVLLGEVLVFLMLLHLLWQRTCLLPRPGATAAISLLFFGLLFLSAFFTPSWSSTLTEARQWFAYLLFFQAAYVLSRLDPAAVHKLFYAPVISAAATGLFGIANYYGIHYDPVISGLQGRFSLISTFGNPNYLSAFLAASLPLTVYLLLKGTRSSKLRELLLLGAYSSILSALLFARTRGALLGLLAAVLFSGLLLLIRGGMKTFLLENRKTLIRLGALSLLLALLFGGTPPHSHEKIESVATRFNSYNNSATNQRFMLWQIAAEMIRDNPLTGVGLGAFTTVYPTVQGEFMARPENFRYRNLAGKAFAPHNEYLHLAAESGLLTAILFFAMLATTGVKLFRQARKRDLRGTTLACGSVLCLVAVHSMVSFPLRLMSSGLLFWMCAGIVCAQLNQAPVSQEEPRKSMFCRGAVFGASLLLPLLILSCIGNFVSDRYLAAGTQQTRQKNVQAAIAEYRRALKWNPWDSRTEEQLGAALSKAGLYGEAQLHFARSQQDMTSELLFNEKAMNFLRQQLPADAIEEFKIGLKFYPNDLTLNMNLALAAKLMADQMQLTQPAHAAAPYLKLAVVQFQLARALTADSFMVQKIEMYSQASARKLFSLTDEETKGETPKGFIFYFSSPVKRTLESSVVAAGVLHREFIWGRPARDDLPEKATKLRIIPLADGALREFILPN